MNFWSRPPPLPLWILSNFQAQRSLTGRSRYGRLAPFPFPRLSQGQESSRRVASWCCVSFPLVGCLVLARRVLAIPTTSAAPERLFSTAGNAITKTRSRLTCDNMEEFVYLHDVCSHVLEWESVKKMRSEWFFLINKKNLPSMSSLVFCLTLRTSSVLCLLTLRLHLIDCDPESQSLFLVSLVLSLYLHIRIYMFYNIFPGTDKTGTGVNSG